MFAFDFFGDLRIVLCNSVNLGLMVGTLRGDGDSETLPAVIKLIFLHLQVVEMLKHDPCAPHLRAGSPYETFTTFNSFNNLVILK